MGQRYEGTLIIQTNDYYSPVGSKILTPVENPASSDDVVPGKGLYDSNGNYIGGSLVDGWPVEIDTEEGMDAFITLENVNRYAKYTGTSSGTSGPITPVNPIAVGDSLSTIHFNSEVEPVPTDLDWSGATSGSDGLRLYLINSYLYFTRMGDGPAYEYMLQDTNGVIAWVSAGLRSMFGLPSDNGWANTLIENATPVVVQTLDSQQDIWGAYISKDGQWTGGTTSKYTSGQIYQVIQQGESAELKPIQY